MAADTVRWIAHAGLAAGLLWGAPTRESLARARTLGVARVELDVAATDAGELVLVHDNRLARGLTVATSTLTALRGHLPELLTLDEGMEVLGDQPVLLDVKGDSATPLGAWLAARPRRWVQSAVCTDDLAALLTLRHAVGTVERWRTLPAVGAGRSERYRRAFAVATRGRLPARVGELVREVAAAGLCCDHLVVTASLCNAAHRLGLPVAAWTIDRAGTARRAVRAGVDLITTNAPEAMRAAL